MLTMKDNKLLTQIRQLRAENRNSLTSRDAWDRIIELSDGVGLDSDIQLARAAGLLVAVIDALETERAELIQDLSPSQVSWEVHSYTPGRGMAVTGSGFGDADPPEPEEVEYTLYCPCSVDPIAPEELSPSTARDVHEMILEECRA